MRRTLKKNKVNNKLARTIASIYRKSKNIVRAAAIDAGEFITKRGKGSKLSFSLFIIRMDAVVKKVNQKVRRQNSRQNRSN